MLLNTWMSIKATYVILFYFLIVIISHKLTQKRYECALFFGVGLEAVGWFGTGTGNMTDTFLEHQNDLRTKLF